MCGAMVRGNPFWSDSEAWTQDVFNNMFLRCDVCWNAFMANDRCKDCPGRGPGGKGIKGDKIDKGKKGFGKQWPTSVAILVQAPHRRCLGNAALVSL